MSSDNLDPAARAEAPGITPVEELFRRLSHPPLTFKEWAAKAPDVFGSAEEVAEFHDYIRVERQRFVG